MTASVGQTPAEESVNLLEIRDTTDAYSGMIAKGAPSAGGYVDTTADTFVLNVYVYTGEYEKVNLLQLLVHAHFCMKFYFLHNTVKP